MPLRAPNSRCRVRAQSRNRKKMVGRPPWAAAGPPAGLAHLPELGPGQRARRARLLLAAALALACLLPLHAVQAPSRRSAAFQIANAALLEAEDGFAARSDTIYLPGETLYLAFNIQGYTADRNSRVKLAYTIDALDPSGAPFVEPNVGKVDTELSPQDAKWMPRVRFSPALPLFVESGKYKFAIRVTDQISNKQASLEVPFQVRGRHVEPSPTLVVRNFAFSREEDGEPLSVAAFRRGDVLWASFDMTGYKIGDKNLLEVEYDLAVLNPEDKQIFKQPEPAREKGSTFYARRYVHAVFNLNLESNIPPAEYTIALAVRDHLGHQTYEGRYKFTVE